MIIYFSANARNIETDVELYRQILQIIRAQGHLVAHDWVENALLRVAKDPDKMLRMDWPLVVREVEAGIESAELVIAEASEQSAFAVGYEVSLALLKRKPVLALVRSSEGATASYVSGIQNELLTVREYDGTNLEAIIVGFINENTISKKDLRFNFVIDRQLHNHLRTQSFKTGKTKAEVVRDLLMKDMQSGS